MNSPYVCKLEGKHSSSVQSELNDVDDMVTTDSTTNLDKTMDDELEFPSADCHGLIDVDKMGDIVLCVSLVDDYCFHPSQLAALSLWDFCAQVDKIQCTSLRMVDRDLGSFDDDEISDKDDNSLLQTESSILEMECTPCEFRFLSIHTEYTSHLPRVRHPRQRLVPISAGAALPCHDRPSSKAQYGRCMLMLFKPWRHAANICGNHDS